MGVDARMMVKTKRILSPREIRNLAWELART